MKTVPLRSVLLICGSLLVSGQGGKVGGEKFPAYPWSEESEFVRVDKRLLRELSIPSTKINRFDTMEFGLTDEFIETFQLTKSEEQQIIKGIADAQHDYRTVEGKHLEPTGETPKLRPLRLREEVPGDQSFHFRPVPFPEETAAIRKRLEEVVRSSLGDEQRGFFGKTAWG